MHHGNLLLTRECGREGRHVLMQASQPASASMLQRLVSVSMSDVRIGRLSVLLYGTARSFAMTAEGATFEPARLAALPRADVALAFNEPPRWLARHAHRLGCSRLLIVCFGLHSYVAWSKQQVERLDVSAWCVEDSLGYRLFKMRYPFIQTGRILVTGSSFIDDLAHAALDGSPIRKRLGIGKSERVLFHSSFPSADFFALGGGKELALEMHREALKAAAIAATRCPVTLVVRTHPRATDEERVSARSLLDAGAARVLVDPAVSYDECVAMADAVSCMPTSISAGHMRYLGKTAALLAIGSAGRVFERIFSRGAEALLHDQGIAVARTVDALATCLDTREFARAIAIPGSSDRLLRLLHG